MHVPNAEHAVVPERKLTEYLLSPTHRDGRSKAAFFMRFGFTAAAWQDLAAALRQHMFDHEVADVEPTAFGMAYVVEGPLHAPDGRTPYTRVVWFVETGDTVPRFVTAYPLKGKSND